MLRGLMTALPAGVVFVLAGIAVAQDLLPADAGADSGAPLWSAAIRWVLDQQRALHRELAAAIRSLRADHGVAAGAGLILSGFTYGVFHAAGPGHGKAVLASYLATHPERFRRGIAMAAASALCQGLTAVVLVYGLVFGAGWLLRDTSFAVTWSERLGYGLLVLLGSYLVARSVGTATGGWGSGAAIPYDHDRHKATAYGCGHRHGPSADEITRADSVWAAAAVVLAVGLRPCSGAILVLAVAKASDLAWAGVAAVAAMSLGTALTVAALAFITVGTRTTAAAILSSRGGAWRLATDVAAIAGGALIALIGGSLLLASFGPAHPLQMR